MPGVAHQRGPTVSHYTLPVVRPHDRPRERRVRERPYVEGEHRKRALEGSFAREQCALDCLSMQAAEIQNVHVLRVTAGEHGAPRPHLDARSRCCSSYSRATPPRACGFAANTPLWPERVPLGPRGPLWGRKGRSGVEGGAGAPISGGECALCAPAYCNSEHRLLDYSQASQKGVGKRPFKPVAPPPALESAATYDRPGWLMP